MAGDSDPSERAVIDVAIGILVDADAVRPRVLISRRRDCGVLGGLWELPGGKVEPGETPAVALAREFEEELGVTIRVGRAYEAIEHVYEHAAVRLHPHRCTLLAGQPSNRQVADHRWADADELAAASFPPANAPLIQRVIQELRRRS